VRILYFLFKVTLRFCLALHQARISLSRTAKLVCTDPELVSQSLNFLSAIVSGLNYTSRIFALLGEILVRIRVDKRSPPQGQFATARLEEVQSLHSRILSALAHCPEPLRLKRSFSQSNVPPEYGGAGFRQATFAEVKDFFDNPNASRENALNPFLVVQGNIYVTQVGAPSLPTNFTNDLSLCSN
jgi:hypothetical protein